MALDVISLIKDAEKKADGILEEAFLKAQEIVRKAEEKAREISKTSEEEMSKKVLDILDDAEEQAGKWRNQQGSVS